MVSIGQVLSAVIEFLNDAQSLGIIKSFTLAQCDANYSEISGAEDLLSQFLQRISHSSIPTKNSSSDDEYIIIDDEKRSESDGAAESTEENSDIGVLVESCNSSVTVNEDEKNSEHMSVSNSPEKVFLESKTEMKNLNEAEIDAFPSTVKKNLVQINVDTSEMKRRISAFISRKRKEVDEWNVQEFCGRSYIDEQDPAWEELDSCARVDAVFVPRRGCKSHIKVSRVHNVWGPQTHSQPEAKKIKQESNENENQSNDASLAAIDERLLNMETHLKLKSDSTLRKNLFKRIKILEDRILYLESTSPEYFHVTNPDFPPKKKINSEEKIYPNSVEELQKRIETLKQSLKLKALHAKNDSNF